MRDEESRHQKERFQSVVLQEDRNIAPLFGTGLGELLEQVRHVSVTDAPVLIPVSYTHLMSPTRGMAKARCSIQNMESIRSPARAAVRRDDSLMPSERWYCRR